VPRESLVGQTIAGYSLQSEVGEGGTSAVFRAQHADHGTVAVKVLRDKLRQDRTAVARFLREARYGERVQHPNVVRTIEIGEAGPGLHFLAIEWAAGEILEKYAKRQGPLPTDEVCAIVKQIADAVHAAHSVNIVHRDLKPENVMYDPMSRAVKLLDFGIATDTDISPEQRLTRAGFFVGTLMYVAPEALSGELVGPLADQYSLATIAYFLLTGCLPFPAKTPREMFSQLLSQPPITPQSGEARASVLAGGRRRRDAWIEQGAGEALRRRHRLRTRVLRRITAAGRAGKDRLWRKVRLDLSQEDLTRSPFPRR
jgi:serine/threonine-protein kinase